ncbi:hypothetical protein [Bradyrhizobium sp. SZCCHNPS1003]|uniref:hypothetical protein n=1 Tax=Bradyrhizobium sp. SZCCHNPS1003 TaxID=3057330 RepID=UPI0028E7C503|nr:hypothetical protein [Bradyrhizobium sp. SZCCHNPS1003]
MIKKFALLAAATMLAALSVMSSPAAAGDYTVYNSTTGQVGTGNLHLEYTAPSTIVESDVKTWPSIGAGSIDTRPSHNFSKKAYAKSTVVESDPSTWYIFSASAR